MEGRPLKLTEGEGTSLASLLLRDRLLYVREMSYPLAEPHGPQRECVQEILRVFMEGVIRYALLRAPLQSGKTGTYQFLIRMMLAMGLVDMAYIVCGSNEKELLNQVTEDVKAWHGEEALNKKVHVVFRQHFHHVHMATRRVLIVNDESHMDCERGQELERFLARHRLSMTGTTPRMIRDHVFMVSVSATPFAEESVLAHGDSLPKAVVRLKVDESYYGPAEYKRDGLLRETYTVLTEEGQTHFREDVRGAWDRNKYILFRLRESAVVSQRAKRVMAAERARGGDDEKQEEQEEKEKYPLTEAEGILVLLEELVAETPGARILHFTSKYQGGDQQVATTRKEAEDFRRNPKYGGRRIPSLDEAPDAPTVILLDGRLRCGKRLVKTHIGMTWDTASSSRTDVILQGLVGRMCGYLGSEGEKGQVPLRREDRPVLYTTISLFEREEKAVVKFSDLERFDRVQRGEWGVGVEQETGAPLLVPRFANHLLRAEVGKEIRERGTGVPVHQCAPLRFMLSEESVRHLSEGVTDAELKDVCWRALVPCIDELVTVNEDLTICQKAEIQAWVECHDATSTYIRRYQGTSNHNMYRHMVRAHRERMAVDKDSINTGNFMTFCVVFEDFMGRAEDDVAGTVYVTLYTCAEGFTRVIPLSSRIAPHDGKTHFIHQAEAEAEEEAEAEAEEKKEVAIGMARYGLTPDITWSPAALETQLDFFLRISLSGIGYMERRFTGIDRKTGIPLSVNMYGEDLCVFRTILRRLEAAHGVRIRYMRRMVRMKDMLFLGCIQW